MCAETVPSKLNCLNDINWTNLSGRGGIVEVDEAKDYEVPGSNTGQELWNINIEILISNSLHGAARSGNICERHMLVIRYQNGWRSNHNVELRMLLVVGAGGGTSQASRDVNGSATHPS
jgi:hypothetical protein